MHVMHVIREDALDIYNRFQQDEANLTLTVLKAKFEEYLDTSFSLMIRNRESVLTSIWLS